VRQVAGALEGGDSLESLDISGNAVGSIGILALAEALKNNQNLRTLEVSYNPIEATGAKALIDMLKFDLKVGLHHHLPSTPPPFPPRLASVGPLKMCL
jgi:Ran GTPase-activating protein (RanGAP) involved in mRNA processing and transport